MKTITNFMHAIGRILEPDNNPKKLAELRERLPSLVETREWNAKKAEIMRRLNHTDAADYYMGISLSAARSIEIIERELSDK